MSVCQYKNKPFGLSRLVLYLALAVLAAPSFSSFADAQDRTRSTSNRRLHPGKGYWSNQRASRSIRHAQDYSRDLYHYSRQGKGVTPDVAKSESEGLGKNIESAKKELAALSKQYEGDKEVQTALKEINKHLNDAGATHGNLHGECCKDIPNGDAVMDCCSDITKELDKAAAEHKALLRLLAKRNQEKQPEKKADK
ncbi:MAG: hypothetical protein JKY95_10185 [Planctomycetaceae bacterium]|nr:hypothetical protein [Planctomycetaceae bacterium]